MADRARRGYMEKNELMCLLDREGILRSIGDFEGNGGRDYGGRSDRSRSYTFTWTGRTYPLRMIARMTVERAKGTDYLDIRVAHARDIFEMLGFTCHHDADEGSEPRVY